MAVSFLGEWFKALSLMTGTQPAPLARAFVLCVLWAGAHFPKKLCGQPPALLLLCSQEADPTSLFNTDTAPT